MSPEDKPLVWLHGDIKSPPFSEVARRKTGFLLRRLQQGDRLGMPHSRTMPSIGPHCHELRIVDEDGQWRIIYRLDPDFVVIVEIFRKKTRKTPIEVIAASQARLGRYDNE